MNNMKKEQKEQELTLEGDFYIDSNFFITSVIDLGNEGESARSIIEEIKKGVLRGHTSTLTLDEVLWIVQREKNRDISYESAKIIIKIPNLNFIGVDEEIMKQGLEIYSKYGLNPRDAIHLACMKKLKLDKIVTADSDFDKIKDVKRIDFTKIKFIEGKGFKNSS